MAYWEEAKAYCESKGGHLVSISDSAENSWITDTLLSGCTKNVYFIGLTLSDDWVWVTGEPFSYYNWDVKEPTYNAGEDYGAIMGKTVGSNKEPGEWIDIYNGGDSITGYELYNCGFICEYEPSIDEPVITVQPSSITVAPGATATFSVTATGEQLSYQWYCRTSSGGTWSAVTEAGGKTSSYSFTARSDQNGYQYYCKVSNPGGDDYSLAVTLTVKPKPTITAQPQSVTASLGSTATFSVTASNATSYQWYYQKPGESAWNQVLDNGQNATFNQTKVATRHDGYKFKCVVKNAAGSVTSSVATLTVSTQPPVITSQPSSVTAEIGSTATFRVTATGATSYQWYYQKPGESAWNQVLDNGQSATFNQKKVAWRHDGYKFKCVVKNAAGSVTSSVATLTVDAPVPVITSQPADVTASLGSNATFSVSALNATGYQWYYQKPGESSWNEVLDNGQSATFTQKKVAWRHDGYKFKCAVSNDAWILFSDEAVLTVDSGAPVITVEPTDVTASLGSVATFRVTATGSNLRYQWYYYKPGAADWAQVIENGQSATFNQKVAERHDGYLFFCIVSNEQGGVASNVVELSVG